MEFWDAMEDSQYLEAVASAGVGVPKPLCPWPLPTAEELQQWEQRVLTCKRKTSTKYPLPDEVVFDKNNGVTPLTLDWYLSNPIGFFFFSSFIKELKLQNDTNNDKNNNSTDSQRSNNNSNNINIDNTIDISHDKDKNTQPQDGRSTPSSTVQEDARLDCFQNNNNATVTTTNQNSPARCMNMLEDLIRFRRALEQHYFANGGSNNTNYQTPHKWHSLEDALSLSEWVLYLLQHYGSEPITENNTYSTTTTIAPTISSRIQETDLCLPRLTAQQRLHVTTPEEVQKAISLNSYHCHNFNHDHDHDCDHDSVRNLHHDFNSNSNIISNHSHMGWKGPLWDEFWSALQDWLEEEQEEDDEFQVNNDDNIGIGTLNNNLNINNNANAASNNHPPTATSSKHHHHHHHHHSKRHKSLSSPVLNFFQQQQQQQPPTEDEDDEDDGYGEQPPNHQNDNKSQNNKNKRMSWEEQLLSTVGLATNKNGSNDNSCDKVKDKSTHGTTAATPEDEAPLKLALSNDAGDILLQATANKTLSRHNSNAATATSHTARQLLALLPKLETIVYEQLKHDFDASYQQSPQFTKMRHLLWYQDRRVVFDDFSMMRVIGKGGFGLVRACQKKTTGKLYAIKTMSKQRIKKKNSVEFVMNERIALADVSDCPFIVNLKYSFHSDDEVYLVLDLMPGGDLGYHLHKKNRFPKNQCLYYAARIMLGLQALHDKNYVYRDLKPDNCLLSADGRVKITDMNLTTKTKPQLPVGVAGTRGYWAPEMHRQNWKTGKRVPYNHVVDWFSFGCCLAEFISGKNPFRTAEAEKYGREKGGATTKELALDYAIKAMDPEFDPEFFTPDAADLCRRLLYKDPKIRLGARGGCQEIMAHPWFKTVDWDAISTDRKKPPFVPPNDVNMAPQYQIGNFADEHNITGKENITFDESDEHVFKDWDWTNPQAYAAEVTEFLIFERELGRPILPETLANELCGCCIIL